ncbi:MAG TPA: Ada metal-binding domain-containing protein, partial [Longimicrobiaceae bacterium]|nr:Ada metal-binding domain-containing protein [Longimicrobiaceae bacterium]
MKTISLPGADEMYRAVAERDARLDGVFVTAVKSTGIFCRPGCPARTPKRENVEFFASAHEAACAGYR